MTEIGGDAFSGCKSLTEITIPDSVTTIGEEVFYNCTGLTEITIPDGVMKIGYGAFANCSNLTEITIPDGVTEIGGGAFFDCVSLTEITIPDSVTKIGGSAFGGTPCTPWLKAKRAENPLVIVNGILIDGETCSGAVTIPDGVTEIGDSAFYKCESLTEITIPDSVTTIGSYAFYDCNSLTAITIPDSVTTIGYRAFADSGLTEITIPDSVTEIGSSAFSGCSSLTAITIPDSVTEISAYAFSGCTGLTEITIPDSVTKIGYRAFYNCKNLDDIYYGGTEDEWNALIANVDYLFFCHDSESGLYYTRNVTVHYNTAPITTEPAVTTTEPITITTTKTATTTAEIKTTEAPAITTEAPATTTVQVDIPDGSIRFKLQELTVEPGDGSLGKNPTAPYDLLFYYGYVENGVDLTGLSATVELPDATKALLSGNYPLGDRTIYLMRANSKNVSQSDSFVYSAASTFNTDFEKNFRTNDEENAFHMGFAENPAVSAGDSTNLFRLAISIPDADTVASIAAQYGIEYDESLGGYKFPVTWAEYGNDQQTSMGANDPTITVDVARFDMADADGNKIDFQAKTTMTDGYILVKMDKMDITVTTAETPVTTTTTTTTTTTIGETTTTTTTTSTSTTATTTAETTTTTTTTSTSTTTTTTNPQLKPDIDAILISPGESYTITIDYPEQLHYRSTNTDVAIVSQSGVVTALGAGTAKIIVYTDAGDAVTLDVTISEIITTTAQITTTTQSETTTTVATTSMPEVTTTVSTTTEENSKWNNIKMGDANLNGEVDSNDIYEVLYYVAMHGAGHKDYMLTDSAEHEELLLAKLDIDGDGTVDSKDIYYILAYVAYNGASMHKDWDEIVK